MATNEEKRRIGEGKRKGQLSAPKEEKELRAYDSEIDSPEAVPPVVETHEDGTPGFIKYGAAVLLGLAFGYGCYVWYSGGAEADYEGHGIPAVATEEYFATAGPFGESAYPDPFVTPYEPQVDGYDLEAYQVDVDGQPVAADVDESVEATSVPAETPAAPASDENADGATSAVANSLVYLFDTDESSVAETPELASMAEQAKKSGATLDIEGYTDNHGSPAYNRKLSDRRAAAVMAYMTSHGVPASQIVCHGNGPTTDGIDDYHNRRVEVSLTK